MLPVNREQGQNSGLPTAATDFFSASGHTLKYGITLILQVKQKIEDQVTALFNIPIIMFMKSADYHFIFIRTGIKIETSQKNRIMRKYIIIAAAISGFILQSCEKNPLYIDGVAGDMLGHWIEASYNDTTIVYKRASGIPEGTPGWTFIEDGSLINRANSGFCGTPPISYADYKGNWVASDSIIDISVEFWGGILLLKWQILEISESELEVYQLSQETIFEN